MHKMVNELRVVRCGFNQQPATSNEERETSFQFPVSK